MRSLKSVSFWQDKGKKKKTELIDIRNKKDITTDTKASKE